MALDEKAQSGALSAKSAINMWGTATRMCDDAFRHKNPAILCREDNPARDVRGPDRAPSKSREFLYPSEFLRFVEHPEVPLGWKQTVAVAVYTFMRLGELQALRWQDVNLDNRTIHVQSQLGVKRESLFNVEETSRRLVFHDLRGTGITWHAVAGTEPLRIQQWAGHTDLQTTQGYLVTADAVGRDNFGEPFPELPKTLTYRQDFSASPSEVL